MNTASPPMGPSMSSSSSLCRQDLLEYQKIVITDSRLHCDTEEAAHVRLEMLLNLTPAAGSSGSAATWVTQRPHRDCRIPMEIGERTLLKMILRVHLEHVSYPHIAQIIAFAGALHTPAASAVDNGGNGSPWSGTAHLDKYGGWSWKAGSRDMTSAA